MWSTLRGLALTALVLTCGLPACAAGLQAGAADASAATAAAAVSKNVAPATADQPSFVHADGRAIKDGRNQPLKLNGVNLGGWLLWEGWIWGGEYDSESTIMERLDAAVGTAAAAAFRRDIYARFITEQDIARIAAMGFNTVRVPINHKLLEDDAKPYQYQDAGWQVLDRLLGWCEKYHLYVVLDLAAAPGGQSKYFCADPEGDGQLWSSAENQARTVAWWKAVAGRYQDRAVIAGYDLLDEPVPPKDAQLVPLYKRIVAAVREVDVHHMVILEGTDGARDFSMFDAPLTPNQAYSFHLYTWLFSNPKKILDHVGDVSKKQNVPVWNGEFGEDKYDTLKDLAGMFDDPDRQIAGHCFWLWKKVPNKYPHLLGVALPDKWKDLIGWVGKRTFYSKPSPEEAAAAIKEFLAAVDAAKNETDPKMCEILGVKPPQ